MTDKMRDNGDAWVAQALTPGREYRLLAIVLQAVKDSGLKAGALIGLGTRELGEKSDEEHLTRRGEYPMTEEHISVINQAVRGFLRALGL